MLVNFLAIIGLITVLRFIINFANRILKNTRGTYVGKVRR